MSSVIGRSRTRLSGGVIDRIGDRGGDTDDADLAQALHAEPVAVVRLLDENHLDVVYVGVHRHMILGDVGVHDAAEPVIDQRLLVQRHADAPDHAAEDLAASRSSCSGSAPPQPR